MKLEYGSCYTDIYFNSGTRFSIPHYAGFYTGWGFPRIGDPSIVP